MSLHSNVRNSHDFLHKTKWTNNYLYNWNTLTTTNLEHEKWGVMLVYLDFEPPARAFICIFYVCLFYIRVISVTIVCMLISCLPIYCLVRYVLIKMFKTRKLFCMLFYVPQCGPRALLTTGYLMDYAKYMDIVMGIRLQLRHLGWPQLPVVNVSYRMKIL